MKRNGDIRSMFQKHSAKKLATASPSLAPAANVVVEENQEQVELIDEIVNHTSPAPSSVLLEEIEVEDVLPPPPSPPQAYDINRLSHDPGLRLPITSYHVNDQDAIRRSYILRGPFKPINHQFPKRKIGDRDRSCSPVWLFNHNWVEYSINKDAIFCFYCYLFKDKNNKGKGTNAFTVNDLLRLELQLDNYIDVVRRDDRFKDIHSLSDLSVKLVAANIHTSFDMVYLLLKLVLLLPVATASVERVFSALKSVKTDRRNKIGDIVLDDCLVTFIERKIFFEVDEEDIIETFMSIRHRRPDKPK